MYVNGTKYISTQRVFGVLFLIKVIWIVLDALCESS